MFFTLTKLKAGSAFLLFVILHSASMSWGQLTQAGRIEIPIKNEMQAHSVFSLDTSGLLLYRQFVGQSENLLELTRLDTALQKKWNGLLPLPKGFELLHTQSRAGMIYFLCKNATPGKFDFTIIVLNAKSGNYNIYSIKNLIAFNATEFVAINHAVFIGGYFNFRPLVLFYSFLEKRSRALTGFLNEPGELTQMNPHDDGNVDVVVSARNASRKKSIWIRQYDNSGELVKTIVVEPTSNKNLIFGRVVDTGHDNLVAVGVYGRNVQYSRGIFVADINSFGEYIIRYYNFADLKNFFHYLKAKREKRILARIQRRRIKGKKIKFNYRMLVHELIPIDGKLVMVGEAFYPVYSNRSSNYSGFINNSGPYGYSPWRMGYPSNFPYYQPGMGLVLDGYQYTHAIAIGFDQHGKPLWDNSFEINGVKSYQLEQHIKVQHNQNQIDLIYLYENKIRTKTVKDGKLQEDIPLEIKTLSQPAVETLTNTSKLDYWYNRHLIVYGTQYLKSSAGDEQVVFFVNKLVVN